MKPDPKKGRAFVALLVPNSCARVRAAFTLLELLVIIAVIAVLVAFLLPTLGRAREKARRVQCISQQKQWAMAFRMYADDNDEMIPREGYERLGGVALNNWIQVKGKIISGSTTDSADVWYNALPEYVGVPTAASYAPVDKHRDFYSSSSLFHCPTAKLPGYVTRPTYLLAIFSVAMNSQLIEFPRYPTISFTELRDEEARTVIFLDNLLEGEKKVHPAQENDNLGQPASYADRFSARHSNGGNLAFADGHVAWFPGNKVVETNPNSPLRGGPIMPPVDVVWEPKYDF